MAADNGSPKPALNFGSDSKEIAVKGDHPLGLSGGGNAGGGNAGFVDDGFVDVGFSAGDILADKDIRIKKDKKIKKTK